MLANSIAPISSASDTSLMFHTTIFLHIDDLPLAKRRKTYENTLVTGHWSLITGHWSLVTDHRSLITVFLLSPVRV